jgi:hypothetical protein
VKFVEDARRNEPVNVGLIVANSASIAARFAGETNDRLDLRLVQPLVRSIPAREMYRNWWRFWRRMLAEGEPGLERILKRSTNNFYVEDAATVLVGDDAPEALLAEFYEQLVGPAGDGTLAQPAETLTGAVVEDLLERAGISHRPELQRNRTLSEVGYSFPKDWRFHYVYRNGGPPIVGERVPSQPWQAAGLLWRYSKLPGEIVRVSFLSSADPVPEEEDIRDLSVAVDLADPELAADIVRGVFLSVA